MSESQQKRNRELAAENASLRAEVKRLLRELVDANRVIEEEGHRADEQLARAEAAEAENERLAAENICDACAGVGSPVSRNECMCGGTGRMSDAAIYLREQLTSETRRADRLAAVVERVREIVEALPRGDRYSRVKRELLAALAATEAPEPGEPRQDKSGLWWCCAADYPNHEPGCKNAPSPATDGGDDND